MSTRRLTGLTAVHVLLLVALLEVAINRVAVPMLRPGGAPPSWHTYLDYVGLFLFYFAGTLATLLLMVRCWQGVGGKPDLRAWGLAAQLAITTLLAAAPLVVDAPAALSLTLEVAFAVSVVAIVAAGFGRGRDLGAQIGLVVLAIPLVLHAMSALGARFMWADNMFDGPGAAVAQGGLRALCLAALLSPYCFAPRPFARGLLRARPLLAALVVAGAGAVLLRGGYAYLAKAASLAIGVELSWGQADPRLAVFVLAVATLACTLAACTGAASPARRSIGLGLALIALGGYGFKWPHHYLLPLLGLVLIRDGVRTVRDEELAALPIASARRRRSATRRGRGTSRW